MAFFEEAGNKKEFLYFRDVIMINEDYLIKDLD
jgi:hypothetical protein